jgi:hypothetical protein
MLSLACTAQPRAGGSPTPVGAAFNTETAAAAVAPGALAPERLGDLQKGIEGRATVGDLVTLSPPNANMGVLAMLAGEIEQDRVAAIVAANNFGPAAASIGDYIRLRDREGRAFDPQTRAQFPQYDGLLDALREQRKDILGDRELIGHTRLIQPSSDAFVLLVFRVAADSAELTLVPR